MNWSRSRLRIASRGSPSPVSSPALSLWYHSNAFYGSSFPATEATAPPVSPRATAPGPISSALSAGAGIADPSLPLALSEPAPVAEAL
jgi:hypothetical protein